MREPLDRPLAAIFATCRDYYLTNIGDRTHKRGEFYKQVQKALTATLRAMAALHAVKYPGYVVDKDHAGYLIKFEPPMLFRVPYHVLPAFPSGEELEEIWQLSRVIRSGNRSTISISGSTVLRKIFDPVGDIDFCEYFPLNDLSGFDRLVANMDGNEKFVCTKLALADKRWHFPWGDDRPTTEFFSKTIDSSDEKRSTVKVDYIGCLDHLGVTEITNLIIAVDGSGNSAGFAKTFAAQEVPLVPIDWLPNQMNDPIEMGRYINWLTDSIVALSKKGCMRKCLKRCASLSRVLFATETTDEIFDLARKNSTFLSHKLSELEKLSLFLKHLEDDRAATLGALVAMQSKELTVALAKLGGIPDEFARKRFDEEVASIVNRLLRFVQIGDHRSTV